ncbi:MAG: hypothetical protein VCA36_11170, partial [Opitutales bacterium]
MKTLRNKLSQILHASASSDPVRREGKPMTTKSLLASALFVPLVSSMFLLSGTVAQAVVGNPKIIVDNPSSSNPIPVTVTFESDPLVGPPGLTGGTLGGNMSFNANPGNLGVDPLGPSASELT